MNQAARRLTTLLDVKLRELRDRVEV